MIEFPPKEESISGLIDLATVRAPGVAPFDMYVHAEDQHLSPSIRDLGLWEGCETQVFTHLIGSGETVLDIGANIGYYALLASKLVGASGRVFAFEPERANFDVLKRNLALNQCGNVIAEQVGVADRRGIEPIYLHPVNRGGHSLFCTEGRA